MTDKKILSPKIIRKRKIISDNRESLFKFLNIFLNNKYTGNIQINIHKGIVVSWNKTKTYKPEDMENDYESI